MGIIRNICILLSGRWLKPEIWGRGGLSDLVPVARNFHWNQPFKNKNLHPRLTQMCPICKAMTNKHRIMTYVVSGLDLDWTFAAQAFPYQTQQSTAVQNGWLVTHWVSEARWAEYVGLKMWNRSSSINTTGVLWTRIPADTGQEMATHTGSIADTHYFLCLLSRSGPRIILPKPPNSICNSNLNRS